jgi:hypothetical protein
MDQKYLPRFEELFLGLTGKSPAQTQRGEDDWLFLPHMNKGGPEHELAVDTIRALGSREVKAGDESAGWWVKPWPIIESKRFYALTLSAEGAGAFTYLRDGKPGQRHAYYIDEIRTGSVTGAPMLLGQFLFEFEVVPEAILSMESGGSNRIYFPRDRRISAYDALTPAEAQDTLNRLRPLGENQP